MVKTDPRRDIAAQMLATPSRWYWWPFLAVSRRRPDGDMDLGVVYDGFHAVGLTGYSATVFRLNIFDVYRLPSLDAFLATEHETFDTTDELLDAGWRAD